MEDAVFPLVKPCVVRTMKPDILLKGNYPYKVSTKGTHHALSKNAHHSRADEVP